MKELDILGSPSEVGLRLDPNDHGILLNDRTLVVSSPLQVTSETGANQVTWKLIIRCTILSTGLTVRQHGRSIFTSTFTAKSFDRLCFYKSCDTPHADKDVVSVALFDFHHFCLDDFVLWFCLCLAFLACDCQRTRCQRPSTVLCQRSIHRQHT